MHTNIEAYRCVLNFQPRMDANIREYKFRFSFASIRGSFIPSRNRNYASWDRRESRPPLFD